MLNEEKYDFLIVGAGIMGLSVAKELKERFPSAKIAIIEKEMNIGMHASGRNSGVLHSGVYYPKDTLKAKVCADGARKMIAFAKEHNIPCETLGKIIIATSEDELPIIDSLFDNASTNGIKAIRVDEHEIKEIEPYSNPFEYGLYVPETANINSQEVLKKLQQILTSKDIKLHMGCKVLSVQPKYCTVVTSAGKFHYSYLFNCAGAGSAKIAKMFGLSENYSLLPFKGIYYKLSAEKRMQIRGNIYPVPNLRIPFLGVHFTRTIAGEVYVGPTAIPALGPENYSLMKGVNIETFCIMKDIACMYIANQQHFRHIMHSEMKKYMKRHFIASVRKLVPTINANDLLASGKVGIRAQLINTKKRKIEMDYIVEQDNNSMHVLNAISPAFTSAFCFAELLINRM